MQYSYIELPEDERTNILYLGIAMLKMYQFYNLPLVLKILNMTPSILGIAQTETFALHIYKVRHCACV
jgi:hypothetical protein